VPPSRDATATAVLADLDIPDGPQRCRIRQPGRSVERQHDGEAVTGFVMCGCELGIHVV